MKRSIKILFHSRIVTLTSPSKFLTGTIFLHAHLQAVYYNCVKFHLNPMSRLGGVVLTSPSLHTERISEYKLNYLPFQILDSRCAWRNMVAVHELNNMTTQAFQTLPKSDETINALFFSVQKSMSLTTQVLQTLPKSGKTLKRLCFSFQCLKWTVAQSSNVTNILFGRPKAGPN